MMCSAQAAEPPFSLELTAAAARQARKLPRRVRNRIRSELEELATGPRVNGVKKLVGVDAYRLRAGDYRIVFRVETETHSILVLLIAHRREVYERLRRMSF